MTRCASRGPILLGNGGDNSVGSQGTFYEGAMTAAGTFPSDATDQLVQANVVAARYDLPRLSLAPASATATPPGLQTFSPGSSQDTTVTFTNNTEAPAVGLKSSISVPKGWTSVAQTPATFADPGRAGRDRERDLQGRFGSGGLQRRPGGQCLVDEPGERREQSETTAEKVRNVKPDQDQRVPHQRWLPTNSTNSFVELYNAGGRYVDLSN